MMHLSKSNDDDAKGATQVHSKDKAGPAGWEVGRRKLETNYENPMHWRNYV